MGHGKNEGAQEYWKRYSELAGAETKDMAVALKVDTTTSTLSSWKTGGRFPPANFAVEIAEYFGTTVEFMVKGRKSQKNDNFEDRRLLELAKKYQKVLFDLEDIDELQRSTVMIQIEAVADSCRETAKKKNG